MSKLYELINPSDPYTFYAPSIDVAGAVAILLNTGFGAAAVDGSESTPILIGWNDWLSARGMDDAWIESHYAEIADAYDSFLIGRAAERADVESMLAMIEDEGKRQQWRAERQERHRSSMSAIGERAYELAKVLRQRLQNASEVAK